MNSTSHSRASGGDTKRYPSLQKSHIRLLHESHTRQSFIRLILHIHTRGKRKAVPNTIVQLSLGQLSRHLIQDSNDLLPKL